MALQCVNVYRETDHQLIYPQPSGQNGTAEAAGTLSKDIENGAYVKLHITFGPITILKTTVDLCEQIKSADKECPIQKGPADAKKDFKMPQEIPNVSNLAFEGWVGREVVDVD